MDSSQVVLPYVSLPGLSGLGIGGVLAGCAYASRARARQLNSVWEVESLTELHELARRAPRLPLLVAVTGRVDSKLPLQCEISKDEAVIHEVTEKEFVWRTKLTGASKLASVTLRDEDRETEWFLKDNSGGTVWVEGGARAEGLQAALVKRQRYREASKHAGHAHSHGTRKMDGTRKTERYLPVGAKVMVVGELDKVHSSLAEADGELVLRRPTWGSPFYITKMSFEELQREQCSAAAALFQGAAWAYGIVGAGLIATRVAGRLLRSWRMRRMKRRIERERAAAMAAAAAARAAAGVEPQPDARASTCIVCLEKEVESVYIPCGHLCCCMPCSTRVDDCPICRSSTGVMRVFHI